MTTMTRAGAALAKTFTKTEIVYTTNAQGDQVRMGGTDSDTARFFLLNRRAFRIEEALEEIGEGWVKYWLKAKMIKKDSLGTYWLSTKMRDVYKLPSRTNLGLTVPFYPYEG